MIDNKPTDEFLEKLIVDRVYPMDNGGYVKVGDDLVALARELQDYRNAQQVVPGDGRADFEEWMLKKWGRSRQEYDFVMGKFLHGENYADSYTRHMWKAWTASRAAMQSAAVKDGWVACSERMPDEIAVSGTMDFGEQCYADGWNKCRMEMLNKKVINQQANKKTIVVNYLIDEIDKQSSKCSR